MQADRQLATWLIRQRGRIAAALAEKLGAARPDPGSAEAEALRRFRSFVSAALLQGPDALPALEGLRPPERPTEALLRAWIDAASAASGPEAPRVRAALEPLLERFRAALRGTAHARRTSGAPRSSRRRAVSAAIDRIADAFLAVDADSGRIEDANPAAGALLGTTRDGLLGADAMRFVPERARDLWWAQLDAVAEGCEPQRFRTELQDEEGRAIAVEACVTRFATRRRTLALVLARPGEALRPASCAGTTEAAARRPPPPRDGTSPGGSRS